MSISQQKFCPEVMTTELLFVGALVTCKHCVPVQLTAGCRCCIFVVTNLLALACADIGLKTVTGPPVTTLPRKCVCAYVCV